MTTPGQTPPTSLADLLGLGAFQIGDGGSTQYGQDLTEDGVNSLVGKLPFANLDNMLDMLLEVLLKLPIEALEAFKSIVPDWLEDGVESVASAAGKIISALDPRKIPQYVEDFELWVADFLTRIFGGLLRLLGISTASIADVANAATDVATKADTALQLAEWTNSVNSIRNNKPLMSGVDETEESNFLMDKMFTGGSAPAAVISATAASVPVAYWRAEQDAKKGFISWFGKGFADITDFRIDLYKADYSINEWSRFHTSPNLIAQLDDDWTYQIYRLADASAFDVAPGDVYGVGWRVVGTGTHSIGGIAAGSWLPEHPDVDPKKPASTRTGGGDILFSSTAYSGNIPWFGIGINSGDLPPAYFAPRMTPFVTPGTYTFTVTPAYNFADLIGIGSGGTGGSAVGALTGQGGTAAPWEDKVLERGVDIPLTGDVPITVVVAASGAADEPLHDGPGGLPTTFSWTDPDGDVQTLSCPGGLGGNAGPIHDSDNDNPNSAGLGSGDHVYRDTRYFGSVDVARGHVGDSPGGGGAGGLPLFAGKIGGTGFAAVVVRQSEDD